MVNGHDLFTQFVDVNAMWNEANMKWSKTKFNTSRLPIVEKLSILARGKEGQEGSFTSREKRPSNTDAEIHALLKKSIPTLLV